MSDIDARVEALIEAICDGVDRKAGELKALPVELVLAAVAFAVRISLGATKDADAAKQIIVTLLNNYFEQAETSTRDLTEAALTKGGDDAEH
ncbi:hypothetical protein [Paradevosia shaoguanensis]|uniref:hypothetical protein n=1 Tax=Paradevosia shaoguanensis TaxID=1335043 RepID=UPI003C70E2C5